METINVSGFSSHLQFKAKSILTYLQIKIILECGAPVVSNYTRVYGNQYSVGSRLLLECEATGMVHASQCLNNGSWSHDQVDIECGKIKMIRIK